MIVYTITCDVVLYVSDKLFYLLEFRIYTAWSIVALELWNCRTKVYDYYFIWFKTKTYRPTSFSWSYAGSDCDVL